MSASSVGHAVQLMWRRLSAPTANRECRKLGLYCLGCAAVAALPLRSLVQEHWQALALCVTGAACPAALLLRNYLFTFLLMPSQVISTIQADAQRQRRTAFVQRNSTLVEEVSLPSGAETIDALVVHPPRLRSNWKGADGASGPRREELQRQQRLAFEQHKYEECKRLQRELDGGRWVIWANANGVSLEENVEFAGVLAKALDCSVLLFNYRGVGRSTGRIHRGEDLVDDTIAVLRYVTEQRHVATANVTVHGHSMGGAAAVLAVARLGLRDAAVVNDRSFASLTLTAKAILGSEKALSVGTLSLAGATLGLLAAAIGAAAGKPFHANMWLPVHVALGVWQYMRYKRASETAQRAALAATVLLSLAALWHRGAELVGPESNILAWLGSHLLGTAQICATGAYLGPLLHWAGLSSRVVAKFMHLLGWGLDTEQAWEQCGRRKLVIVHRSDGIIRYDCSLAAARERVQGDERRARFGRVFELRHFADAGQFAHMYLLNQDPREWEELLRLYRSMLDEKP
eukprot:TRINITY_DN47126_c0_g1_i1.p1 TRINITY_DN47126_c0_g1~~TRINITY_DN47126_c0_g1_i1.p1  ORF type:complete len:552 (+),score=140.33 TRINITY_DN47126_c0_g1_i1:108-1658(+)